MSSKNWAKRPGWTRKCRIGARGQPNRRCLEVAGDVREGYCHATKGRRRRREPQVCNNAAGDLYASFLA